MILFDVVSASVKENQTRTIQESFVFLHIWLFLLLFAVDWGVRQNQRDATHGRPLKAVRFVMKNSDESVLFDQWRSTPRKNRQAPPSEPVLQAVAQPEAAAAASSSSSSSTAVAVVPSSPSATKISRSVTEVAQTLLRHASLSQAMAWE